MPRKTITSIALAAAVMVAGLATVPAQALVLGQVRIQSSLGEPLKAEIPVSQLTKDELASLVVSIAAPGDFSSRGLIYNSTLSSMRVYYEATSDNTAVIHVRSSRPMQDPFIDLLMDVRWRAGNVQRSYTMLIDPPKTLMNATSASVTPTSTPPTSSITPNVTQTAPSAGTAVSVLQTQDSGAPAVRTPTTTSINDDVVIRERILAPNEGAGFNRPTQVTQTSPSQQTATTARPSQAQQTSYGDDDLQVRVGRGQTLGNIANSVKPAGVSTEQMLIAIYKANPSAFINNNINWVKAGATLRIPTDDEIAAVSRSEAKSVVSAHARQFNERRSQMAQSAGTVAPVVKPGDTSGGRVTPIEPPTPAIKPDDVLIIEQDKGNTQAITQQQQVEEDRAREEEIKQATTQLGNIKGEMEQTAGTTKPPVQIDSDTPTTSQPSTPATVEGPGPSIPINGPDMPPSVTIEPDVPVDSMPPLVPQEPEVTEPAVSQPVAEPETPPVVTPPPVDAMPLEKSFVEKLLDNPIIPLGAGAVVLLLVGGVILVRRRKSSHNDDYDDDFFDDEGDDDDYDPDHGDQSSDSFMLDQSSSIYAASQLDANADVDPVQEADVYLAYGRDEQAAEILRDALSSDSNRPALHAKLCEVYARQNDVIAFEEQAMRLHSLTGGVGPDWERIARLAQSISPHKIAALGASDDVETQKPMQEYTPTTQPAMMPVRSEAADTMAFMNSNDDFGDDDFDDDTGVNIENNFDDLDVSLDFSKSVNHDDDFSSSDSPSFSMDDEDDEGPSTRLALAEEFVAIGNKQDAKEIIEEVLQQNVSAEVRKRASNLLGKVS